MPSTQDALSLAIDHAQAGRLAEAEALCARILEAEPGEGAALRLLGMCAEKRGDLDRALSLAAELFAATPAPSVAADLARLHNDVGTRRRHEYRPAEAARHYRRAIALQPDLVAAYNNLGSAEKEQGLSDQAFANYARTLALRPDLGESLNHLRMVSLRNRLLATYGPTVLTGPFAGMLYDGSAAEGWYLPRMLGCYEQELHPHLAALAGRGYETVVNVGCAEGYYAVGLARLMPGARVFAHDINENAQTACRRLAERNGVAGRLSVGGLFTGGMLEAFRGRRTLLVCDIEGFELELLDPARFPALRGIDVVVELHDCFDPGLSRTVTDRFRPTHDVVLIENGTARQVGPAEFFESLSPAERFLAVAEFRDGPTPWAVMTARGGAMAQADDGAATA